MSDTLFDVDATPPPTDPAAGLSTDQRRALRQTNALARGRHPLELVLNIPLGLHTDAASADDRTASGLRCRTCRFRLSLRYHDKSYAKCTFGQTEDRRAPRISHGAATDIRAWWPACRDFQPSEDA